MEAAAAALAEPAAAEAALPRVLAEGDSWFAYPREYFIVGHPANVVDWLHESNKFDIQCTASNGDEAVAMLSGSQKLDLLERLDREKYALILFSGGGNDVVGAFDFPFFIRRFEPGMTADELLIHERLQRRLEQITNAYLDLVEWVGESKQNGGTPIVSHAYDLAVPMEKGATFVGGVVRVYGGRSWMHPWLLEKGIVDKALQKAIVHKMLVGFKECLQVVQAEHPQRFHLVETQGTLQEDEWLNEIHPTSAGFEKIAKKIEAKMTELLGVA
jgi:hypothetical protein